jgi:hypothetical protein
LMKHRHFPDLSPFQITQSITIFIA